jgi:hypothetical protein
LGGKDEEEGRKDKEEDGEELDKEGESVSVEEELGRGSLEEELRDEEEDEG